MTGSSAAGIITAFATVLTATGGLFLGLAKFLPELRRSRKAAEATKAAVEEVHVIVNQQRTDMLNLIAEQAQRNRVLALALRRAGVEVPADAPHGELSE